MQHRMSGIAPAVTLALLLAAAAGVASQAAPALKAPGIVRKQLQGRLSLVTLDDEGAHGQQWALAGDDGVLQPFVRGVVPPKKDKDGRDVEPGAVVGLNCPVDPATGACSYLSPTDVTLLNGAPAPTAAAASQRLLVIIIDYSATCAKPSSLTESAVRTLYLGPNLDGAGGHAVTFERCSYGKLTLDPSAFTVVTVRPNCTTDISSSCSWSAIANGADAAAQAVLGSTVYGSFTHRTYILPPGFESICRWSGLALLPGRQTWLQTSSYGVNRWATVMQESIHNCGLWHSWQGGVEYNDYSTSMGRGDTCPNAAEISRMGWASPATGGAAISSAVLPPATSGGYLSYNLPATYLTGTGNYIRVRPDWLGSSYSTTLTGRNLYLAVRVAKVGDAALGTSYAGLVNVHEVNATMDNGLPNSYANSDRQITFVAGVASGTRVVLPSYRLVVYGSTWVGQDIMRVFLCRYDAVDGECPSLSAMEGRPSLPPPPSPLPPSPPPPPRTPSPPPPPSSSKGKGGGGGGGPKGRRMLRA